MASLNEIVGILAERTGRTFDVAFQEELKVLVNVVGNKFLKDSLAKRPQDRQYYVVSFVAPVKRVSKIECPIDYGCTLRTKDEIPTPIRANNILFEFVGSADFEIPYSQGGSWRETFFKFNKFTARNNRYEYRDRYIYIKDDENAIEYIGIQMIPEDILAVRAFKCLSGNGLCDFDDSPYPLPADLIEPLITNILTTKLGVILPRDKAEVKVDEKSGH